jgi:hypothetical protein
MAERWRKRFCVVIDEPGRERLWAVDGEQSSRAGVRVEPVLEARLATRRHVRERQRLHWHLEVIRHTLGVVVPLRLDVGEDSPCRLRLEHAERLAVDEEQVVGTAMAGG